MVFGILCEEICFLHPTLQNGQERGEGLVLISVKSLKLFNKTLATLLQHLTQCIYKLYGCLHLEVALRRLKMRRGFRLF